MSEKQYLYEIWKRQLPLHKRQETLELVTAVQEGDEEGMKSALFRGAYSQVTVPTNGVGSRCLVGVAANRGHSHLLPILLRVGLNIEGEGTSGRSPLMEAALRGHTQTVKALLTLGANALATDNEGMTALHYAAQEGHQQCVEILIRVIPPFPLDIKSTPLHLASCSGRLEVMKQLADGGWPLTAVNRAGATPLHWAAMGGSVVAAEWLVQRCGNPLVKDNLGRTPLDIAVLYGCHEVETWLTKNGGSAVRREDQYRMMVEKVQWKHEDDHHTILSWIVEGNEAAMSMIPDNIDGHTLNREGLTPLHSAALYGAPSFAVEALLGRGVSPHVITPDNMTAADLAKKQGHVAVIKGLQQHQCAQNASSSEQLYEELLTTISHKDDVQTVSSLLCKGVPIEPLGRHSLSALRLAVTSDRSRIVSLLLAKGALLSASLLQDAWQSPDVTPKVLASITTAYCCRLRAEQNRLEKVSNNLVKGINNLLETIEGNSPWEATWRWCKDTNRATLSDLLAKATAANCPVTAAFLHKAGAWSFFSGTSGSSALHAALEAGHQGMAELLIRELGGCPYVLDTYGRLPIDLMTDEERRKLEQRLFEEEREKLKDLVLRQKAYREKEAVRRAIYVQKVLFRSYKKNKSRNISDINGRTTLLLASRKGLLQLTHLLLQVGRLPVDKVIDNICGTTALHEAASHGQDGCVSLLLSAGADSQQRDTYGQTPRLLAALFGNTSTFDLLAHQEGQDSTCRAGTTATQVQQNFKLYHNMYYKYSHNLIKPFDRHCPENVIKKILKAIDVEKLQQEAVDFSKGEALEVKEAVMEELNTIIKKVSSANPIYRGELKLTGSSQDGSKLYAPDEFDVNIVIKVNDVKVRVSEREKTEALLKGKLLISVDTDNPHLKGQRFMDDLYMEVHQCLEGYSLQDKRLSLVPPGLTSTQVGVALALAWQGQEYPLMLVSVDLVPVLEVPWLEEITRPFLTPEDTTTIQLSNAADGSWRCSFTLTETKVIRTISPAERKLQVRGKILLSRLKAERWMPRHKKSFCTWFATREWNIPVPSGFCFKNALFRWLEQQRRKEKESIKKLKATCEEDLAKELGDEGKDDTIKGTQSEKDLAKNLQAKEKKNHTRWLIEVFRLMCANPEESRVHLANQNSPAYFGGDCEGLKSGYGAPIIVQYLEENLEKLQHKT